MSLLFLILFFSLVGGVLSVLLAALILLTPLTLRNRFLPHMVSFAIGALLGASFLGLLPHALIHPAVTDVHNITFAVLLGILGFFLLEKGVLWRHCHADDCEAHLPDAHGHGHHHAAHPAGTLILVGDAIHNLVDGVLIAAAFLTDEHLGIVTALAVIAHEIPQEVGDFAILLQSGYSRAKAIAFNILSSLTTVVGALLAYFTLQDTQAAIPYVLAVAAASFIYVAVADLIPGLHKRLEPAETLKQIVLIGLGVMVIYITHSTLH